MNTNRLYFRERTSDLLRKVINESTENQLLFFGCEDVKMLNFELTRIQNALKQGKLDFRKWDLIEKSSDNVIGNCGYHNCQIIHKRAELGYLLHEKFRGKGFMIEALKCIIDFGFSKMELNRIEAFISPDNFSSTKLITTLNFVLEGKLCEHYNYNDKLNDSLVFGLLKSEYRMNKDNA